MDLGVAGCEREALTARLGDQHAIERVAMQEGEPAGDNRVVGGDGQVSEPCIVDDLREVG